MKKEKIASSKMSVDERKAIIAERLKKRPHAKVWLGGTSRTKQSFKEECDINKIVDRAAKAGVLQDVLRLPDPANYLDVSSAPDFLSAQNLIIKARSQFDALPAKVRNRFQNDPSAFLAFASDPKNKEGMRELGLLKEEQPKPVKESTDPKPAAGEGPKA